MRFTDKVIVITGAARGLGQHYAQRFSQEGGTVVAADLNGCEETLQLIQESGGKGLSATVDVTSTEATQTLAERVKEELGRVDVLVNNAGLYGTLAVAPFTELDPDEWDLCMSVNVKGIWLSCKALVPLMKEGGGSIINISSLAGTYGMPNSLHYSTSKAAVIGLTRALAREVARFNIRVNAVAPSVVMTQSSRDFFGEENAEKGMAITAAAQMIKRNLEPEDVAGTVLHLASDATRFITGQTHMVDGGAVLL